VAVLAIVMGPTGCGETPVKLDHATVRDARPQTLLLILRPEDQFENVSMPEQPLGYVPPGLIGAAMIQEWLEEGERNFVRKMGLVDSSVPLGRSLANGLAADFGLSVTVFVRQPPAPLEPGERRRWQPPPARERKAISEADLVLEARSTFWGMERAPYVAAGTHDALRFAVEVSLTDRRSGRLLASGTCDERDPRLVAARKVHSRREVDALLSQVPVHHGFRAIADYVTDELPRAIERCDRKLRSEVFALGPPPPQRAAAAAPPPTSASDGGTSVDAGGD